MTAKIDALLRWLGCGFVPEPMARDHIAAGRLVVKQVQRNRLDGRLGYAWRTPAAARRGAARSRRWAWPCAGGWSSSRARRRARPCSSATAAGSATGSGDALRRPLRAFAHRPAACRLAGGGAGVVARRPGPRRALAGAHRGPRHAAQRRRRGRGHPRAARALRPGAPTRRRCGSRSATRAVRAGARPPHARRPGLRLRLQPARPRARAGAARPAAPAMPSCVYPGTCRGGLNGKAARSFRLRTDLAPEGGAPRPSSGPTAASGREPRTSRASVGDFVLQPRRRRSGPTSWRSSSTMRRKASPTSCAAKTWPTTRARQILLQRQLGLPTPRYLHTPLVLSAQTARSCRSRPARRRSTWRDRSDALQAAAGVLGLDARGTSLAEWLAAAVAAWRARWPLP